MLVSQPPPPPTASPLAARALFLAMLVLTVGVSACLAQDEGTVSTEQWHEGMSTEDEEEPEVCDECDGGADAGDAGDAGDAADAGCPPPEQEFTETATCDDDAGVDAGLDAGVDAGADAGSDAGADGGSDAGSFLATLAPTSVLNPTPTTAADRTNGAERARMRERCGMCELRPRGPIDPNKVPYISVHGISAGPDVMDPAINKFPSNAQVYDFFYPDNRHPMETADCLRNAIVQVRGAHSGTTVQVVAHSLGALIATGADHSLADDEWMPTEVPTNCGFMKKVRGRHRKGFVLEPAPSPSQLDLRMTLIDPVFQGFTDAPLIVSDCLPGRGDLTAGSALMQTLNTRPTFSRQRRVFYAADPSDDTARDLTEFDDDDLELICKAIRGENVRTRKFGLINAWNAVKNLRVGPGGKKLKDALGCGCSAARIKELAAQAAPRLPGKHTDILDDVLF